MVMRRGYGNLSDWKYMLPALLPLAWYQRMVQFIDTIRRASAQPDRHTPRKH